MYLLPSLSCTLSYLELRDGADANSPVIAKLCGNSLPGIQRSSGSTLYMRFRSDSIDPHAGFNVKYSRGKMKKIIIPSIFTDPKSLNERLEFV